MKKNLLLLIIFLFLFTSFEIISHIHLHDSLSDEEYRCLICIITEQFKNLTVNFQNFVFLIIFVFILKITFLKLPLTIFFDLVFSRAPPY